MADRAARPRLLFFGTPAFAAEQLEELIARGATIAGVVSKPDRPQGRSLRLEPTAVKQVALRHALPLFQPEKASSPEFLEQFKALEADLFVVVAYGEIIKSHLLEMPALGCINLHASLLPLYRGAAPIQRSLIEGASETGVTIIHMAKAMDAGDMIVSASLPIDPTTTFGELRLALCELGKPLLWEAISALTEGRAERTPQQHELASYAPKVELEECQLDWDKGATELHNLIRGVNPEPGSWCWVEWRGERRRLKVWLSRLYETVEEWPPATFLHYGPKRWVVACGKGAIELLEVQLEGKKRMEASAFARGQLAEELRFLPFGSISD